MAQSYFKKNKKIKMTGMIDESSSSTEYNSLFRLMQFNLFTTMWDKRHVLALTVVIKFKKCDQKLTI